MMNLIRTNIGRLRLLGMLEGSSLLILVLVAVPLKYIFGNDSLVRTIGPIHGVLFLLFVFNTVGVAIERRWRFGDTTWKILVACIVPFGTFYIDRTILRKIST